MPHLGTIIHITSCTVCICVFHVYLLLYRIEILTKNSRVIWDVSSGIFRRQLQHRTMIPVGGEKENNDRHVNK